jgi:hypothetical protein
MRPRDDHDAPAPRQSAASHEALAFTEGTEGLKLCDETACEAFSWPKGDPFEVGHPPGEVTWMQRRVCEDGHHYMIDLLTEARTELA